MSEPLATAISVAAAPPPSLHPRSKRRLLVRGATLGAIFLLPLTLGACSTEWASMSPSIDSRPTAQLVSEAQGAVRSAASRVVLPDTGTVGATVTASKPVAASQPVTASKPIGGSRPVTAGKTVGTFDGGELAGGSVTHRIALGGSTLVVHYWTEGAASDVVHVSGEIRGADRKHTIKVTRFLAVVHTAGTAGSPDTRTQLSEDRGEFVLTPPYSYTSALEVPRPGEQSHGATELTVTFELLLETAPKSGAFYRATALDDVVLFPGTASTEGATQ